MAANAYFSKIYKHFSRLENIYRAFQPKSKHTATCSRHIVPAFTGARRAKVHYVPVALSLTWGLKKKDPEPEVVVDPNQEIIAEADALYAQYKTQELYDYLLQYKDTDCGEVMWRLCRATCDKGKLVGKDPEKKELFYEAMGYAERALELDDNSFATHKWYGIMLSYIGDYEGNKKKIGNAYIMRDHFLKAMELNPKDATSIYLMGKWCYSFADMAWYIRKIAAALFATPPSSTYEEALEYFVRAEEVDPGFYSDNLLMIGKCYLALNNVKMAQLYLQQARDVRIRKPDDEQTHAEAAEVLKKLGISA